MRAQQVPFYSNTKDNKHCYQAVIKSVLKFYFPNKTYSFKDLDELSGKKEGLWTWPTKTLLDIQKLGIKVKSKSTFNYSDFIKQGGEYLIKKFGKEMAKKQIFYSDIPQEKAIVKKFLKETNHTMGIPTLKEIRDLINDNWLVVVNVNYKPLYKKKGFSGHFVLITEINDEQITFHDPGLPPKPSQKIPIKDFLRAWEYPTKDSRNYDAFKKE